ncbi:hypothetical protein FGO68_gene2989 [Halteria grandinella]|uniref:Uncharacterized protein n=1 Tax=Halteria grandinella TaxID=5974 RepID=A0A8J8NS42_HALGN|nr:hypothetical protein FGO68_gene2989 [Halteria grandinella]
MKACERVSQCEQCCEYSYQSLQISLNTNYQYNLKELKLWPFSTCHRLVLSKSAQTPSTSAQDWHSPSSRSSQPSGLPSAHQKQMSSTSLQHCSSINLTQQSHCGVNQSQLALYWLAFC